MPTINNYTFSEPVFAIEEQTAIINEVGQTATITISPNPGYEATAGDFSAAGFDTAYISNVQFQQDGENVLCVITIVNTSIMPSNNLTLGLCVTGSGVIKEITIAGTLTATIGSNVTPAGETNTPYSASGAEGDEVSLFTRSYAAATNYYLENPSINVTAGNQSNYNIIQTPVYTNNLLTSIDYNVKYLYPSQSINGDHIDIRIPDAKEKYIAPSPRVTNWGFYNGRHFVPYNNSVESTGGVILIRAAGDPDAVFSIVMVDDAPSPGPNTTQIGTNITMPAAGFVDFSVALPDINGILVDSINYTITISGDLDSNLRTIIQVEQFNIKPTISLDATSTQGISGFNTISETGNAITRFISPLEIYINETVTINAGILELQQPYLAPNTDTTPFISPRAGFLTSTTAASNNSTTLNLQDTSGISVGDKFNNSDQSEVGSLNDYIDNSGYINGPFEYEVVSITNTNQIEVTPAITVVPDISLLFQKNNGNNINVLIENIEIDSVSQQSATIQGELYIYTFGVEDQDFTFNLDEIFKVTSGTGTGFNASTPAQSAADCTETSFTQTLYVENDTWVTHNLVYTDSARTNIFSGQGWYMIEDPNSTGTADFAVRILKDGYINSITNWTGSGPSPGPQLPTYYTGIIYTSTLGQCSNSGTTITIDGAQVYDQSGPLIPATTTFSSGDFVMGSTSSGGVRSCIEITGTTTSLAGNLYYIDISFNNGSPVSSCSQCLGS